MEKFRQPGRVQRFAPAALWLVVPPAVIAATIGAGRFGLWLAPLGAVLFFATFAVAAVAFAIRLPRIGLGSRRVALLTGSLAFLAVLAGAGIGQALQTPAERLASAEKAAQREAGRALEAEQVRRDAAAAKAEADAWAATRAEQKKVAAALYPPSPCADATDGRAIVEARSAVRDRLKNPRGATFSPAFETTVTRSSECAFTVIGWVDATNSYGGVIRSRFGVDLDAAADWAPVTVLIE